MRFSVLICVFGLVRWTAAECPIDCDEGVLVATDASLTPPALEGFEILAPGNPLPSAGSGVSDNPMAVLDGSGKKIKMFIDRFIQLNMFDIAVRTINISTKGIQKITFKLYGSLEGDETDILFIKTITIGDDYEDVWVASSMQVEFGPVEGVRRIDIAFQRFENSNAGRVKKLTFYTCMTDCDDTLIQTNASLVLPAELNAVNAPGGPLPDTTGASPNPIAVLFGSGTKIRMEAARDPKIIRIRSDPSTVQNFILSTKGASMVRIRAWSDKEGTTSMLKWTKAATIADPSVWTETTLVAGNGPVHNVRRIDVIFTIADGINALKAKRLRYYVC